MVNGDSWRLALAYEVVASLLYRAANSLLRLFTAPTPAARLESSKILPSPAYARRVIVHSKEISHG